MSPKMEAALRAARRAGEEGLHWTRAGWHSPTDDCWTYHGPVVVSRLVHDRGFLAERGRGRGENARRVITQAGLDHLAAQEAKERRA